MHNTIYSKSDLVHELNSFIQIWIDLKPNMRSLAHLARESNVSDSALRRLKNQKTKISDDMILRVLKAITQSSSFLDISKQIASYRNLDGWLRQHYAYLEKIEAGTSSVHRSLNDIICENIFTLSIFSWVSSLKSVNKDYIRDQFGLRGLFETEKLIETEVIKLEGTEYKLNKAPKDIKILPSQTIAMLPDFLKYFLKHDHAIGGVILRTDAVDNAGYIRLTKMFFEFDQQVAKVIKENPGEIPVVCAGFLDSMTTQPYFDSFADLEDKSEGP